MKNYIYPVRKAGHGELIEISLLGSCFKDESPRAHFL